MEAVGTGLSAGSWGTEGHLGTAAHLELPSKVVISLACPGRWSPMEWGPTPAWPLTNYVALGKSSNPSVHL